MKVYRVPRAHKFPLYICNKSPEIGELTVRIFGGECTIVLDCTSPTWQEDFVKLYKDYVPLAIFQIETPEGGTKLCWSFIPKEEWEANLLYYDIVLSGEVSEEGAKALGAREI